jgi:hypothetical protein
VALVNGDCWLSMEIRWAKLGDVWLRKGIVGKAGRWLAKYCRKMGGYIRRLPQLGGSDGRGCSHSDMVAKLLERRFICSPSMYSTCQIRTYNNPKDFETI